MLNRVVFAALALVVVSLPARAQTTGTLNPLSIIAQFESSSGTNTSNGIPGNTASGIMQDINATWAEAVADCNCGITTAQYPTAASAPSSAQLAANAALYNQSGFANWVCSDCDAPLAAAIQADGGTAAFQAPGTLSTDPAAYAAAGVDTSGGLASYFAGNGISGGLTVSSSGISGNGIVATSAVTGGSTTTGSTTQQTTPFSDAWAAYVTGITAQLQTVLGGVQAMVATPLTEILVLGVAVLGIQTMFGSMSMHRFMAWMLRGCFVVGMVGTSGSGLYQSWVVGPIMGTPQYLAGAINVGPGTTTSTNVASILDAIYNGSQAQLQLILNGLSVSPSTWGDALAASILAVLVILVLAAIWLIFAVVQLCLAVLIALGPLVLLAFLFDPLRRWAWGWIDTIVTLLLQYLVLAIMLGFFSPVIIKLEGAFVPGAAPASDIRVFGGLVVQLIVFAVGCGYLAHLVSRITGGWAPAMSINRVISSTVMMASTTFRGAGTAAQGAASAGRAAIGATRSGSPVGRSLT